MTTERNEQYRQLELLGHVGPTYNNLTKRSFWLVVELVVCIACLCVLLFDLIFAWFPVDPYRRIVFNMLSSAAIILLALNSWSVKKRLDAMT